METNRIDLALALIGNGSQARSADSGSNGTFANLLFDAAGVNQLQMKPMETYALRRRFDDCPTQQIDLRQKSVANVDRRDANRKLQAGWNGESAASISPSSANPPKLIAYQAHVSHSAGYGDASSGDISKFAADKAVDPISDTKASESEREAMIDGDDCGKQSNGGDMNESGASLLSIIAPIAVADETSITSEFDFSAVSAAPTTHNEVMDLAGALPEEIATAAVLTATAALPIGTGLLNEANDVAALPADETPNNGAATIAVSQSVTFSAILVLNDTADDTAAQTKSHINAIAARGEQQIEDAASSFRRNTGGQRRNHANGTGTTAQQATAAQQPAATSTPTTGVYSSSTTSLAGTTVTNGVIPVGFESDLGGTAGFQAWNLHLGQGSASRRGEFVGNLRQHLQNLPAHEQVALSIQRSVRDGNGSITLQLSPSELGRIHLKLNIDEENNVQASIVVERPATLELLQRDMKSLERTLQDAGLRAGPGDLSFSLQGGDSESFASEFGSGNGNGSGSDGLSNGGDGAEEAPAAERIAIVDTADGLVDVQA